MNVLVGMCCGGEIKYRTVLSLLGLLGETPVGAVSIQSGGYKPFNMNKLVEEAKKVDATHLMSIDADMIFPADGLERLLGADKDIVGANYRFRGVLADQDTPASVIKFEGKDGYRNVLEPDFPKELFECGAVGLGFTLIKMSVFDKLKKPYFYIKEDPLPSTEDIVFCQDARKAGIKIFCDPTIKMGHYGSYVY